MSRDTNFYYSFLVLPPRKRRAIIAVWDYCRAVDDAVDEVVPESEWRVGLTEEARRRAAEELERWRGELAACFAEDSLADRRLVPSTEQGRALRPFVAEFGLPRQPFEDLIAGVAMDLDHVRYETFETLALYCRRVASTVGLICVEIFGYRDPRTKDYAVDLGMALQLTNIIRDVRSDFLRGRIYLPEEDLRRFGVTEEMLGRSTVTPEVRDLLRFECDRARGFYRRAAAELPRGDTRSLLAAEIMGAIYFQILRRVERSGYEVLARRVRVPRPRRALIALTLWARALLPAAAVPL
ncbi:MAG: phytoene/squalene synthase family protein [Vicinamibacterales bacterium]